MSGRVNSFAILNDPDAFALKPNPAKPVEKAAIAEIARDNNFPSRQAPKKNAAPKRQQRRWRTGRNQHIGIKATIETTERFYKAAEERNLQHGELLRIALDALERAGTSG